MSNLVYHYTSLQTLYNIIKNQSFWLTDLRSSMDKNEMTYAELLIREKGKVLLGQDFPKLLPAHNFYSLSCTTYADSYFHFNNYADGCMGVAIGIDPDFLHYGVPNNQCYKLLAYHLYFANVLYDPEIQKLSIEQYIRSHCWADSELDGLKDSILPDTYNTFLALIKRPEFTLEQEVRFIYRQDYGGCKTVGLPLGDEKFFSLDDFLEVVGLDATSSFEQVKKLKYGYFGNRIRKYYEFNLEPFGLTNVIKSITIGPRSRQKADELIEYLVSCNLSSVKVINSKIELRD